MSIHTKREQQREELRTAILDAAREMFLRDGVGPFSMRKLAAQIGYSPGTIYLHFAGKAEILRALIDEGFDGLLAALDSAHDSNDPIRSLKNKLRAYIDFGRRFPNHYQFAFLMQRARTGGTIDPHNSFDVLRREVGRCVEAGPFRSLDVETTSQLLWSAIHGLTSLLIVHPEFPWVDQEALCAEVVDTTIHGLCAKAEQSRAEESSA